MSEQKLEVFNVLNFLDNGYEIEDILKEGQFGTFASAEECINHLIDEGYLEGDVSVTADVEITAEAISKKYIVSELKEILKENGLKVSGKKQELVERVLPLLKEAKDASNLNVSASADKSFENPPENLHISHPGLGSNTDNLHGRISNQKTLSLPNAQI